MNYQKKFTRSIFKIVLAIFGFVFVDINDFTLLKQNFQVVFCKWDVLVQSRQKAQHSFDHCLCSSPRSSYKDS